MTIFYPDIASYQAGISLKGALAVCGKATQGTYYVNPYYALFKAEAKRRGAYFFTYHFLEHGSPARQADFAFKVVGKTPMMLDVEPTGVSRPTLYDAYRFVDVFRSSGGIVWLVYLPKWYWGQTPFDRASLAPLTKRGLSLVSSEYTGYAETGKGWSAYGGMKPAIWQYTNSVSFNGYTIDFNAFKGTGGGVAKTLNELKNLTAMGVLAAPAPRAYRHVADGTKSLAQVAAERNTTVAHLVEVSKAHLNATNRAALDRYLAHRMPKGLVYWTSNP